MAAHGGVRGLSATDLDQVRKSLAAGRRPKVVFTPAAGQLTGQQGQVVELADPAADDEWVHVRFGNDTLPFSPGDLALAPRARPARRTPATRTVQAEVSAPAPATAPAPTALASRGRASAAEAAPSARGRAAAADGGDSGADAPPPASAARGRGSGGDGRASGAAPGTAAVPSTGSSPRGRASDTGDAASPTAASTGAQRGAGDSDAGVPAGRRATSSSRARGRVPAALTITMAYAQGEWTVSAQQGTKAVAKPTPVRASAALHLVSLLEVPAVREAVEQIVAAARADAEREAERLRAELAEIEARLAELSDTT